MAQHYVYTNPMEETELRETHKIYTPGVKGVGCRVWGAGCRV